MEKFPRKIKFRMVTELSSSSSPPFLPRPRRKGGEEEEEEEEEEGASHNFPSPIPPPLSPPGN